MAVNALWEQITVNQSPGNVAEALPGYRPLYRQVRDRLVERLASGLWAPGAALPSETELARQLGVSQGTVRKALDEMAAENLLVRRQGRGTFVARHGEGAFLFQFFKLVPDHNLRAHPECRMISVMRSSATAEAREHLGLGRRAEMIALRRLRLIEGTVSILEEICVPGALFPGLEQRDLPNHLYALYSQAYAITIGGGSEKLKAVALPADAAALLGVAPGTPALRIERVATSIEGRKIEWRVSLCLTENVHYLSELS